MTLSLAMTAFWTIFRMNLLQKAGEPMGTPKTRRPSVSSKGFPLSVEKESIARLRDAPVVRLVEEKEYRRRSRTLLLVVVVMIRVFSVLRTAPSPGDTRFPCWSIPDPYKRNRRKNFSTSSIGSRTLTSSTYPSIIGLPPCPSSCLFPLLKRVRASSDKSRFILVRMEVSTKAAKIGEAGHPWEKPS